MFLKPVIAVSLVAGAVHLALPATGQARELLEGPYEAAVERVVDGDTLAVRVRIWLNQELNVLVRVRGIDTPEKNGACAEEKVMAARARARLVLLTGPGPVVLTRIAGGKYWGRVVADVSSANGGDVAAAMLRSGLARRYDGGRRGGWCGAEAAASSIN